VEKTDRILREHLYHRCIFEQQSPHDILSIQIQVRTPYLEAIGVDGVV